MSNPFSTFTPHFITQNHTRSINQIIHPIGTGRLRNAGFLQFLTDIVTAILNAVGTDPANLALIQPELDSLTAVRAPIDAYYATPQGSLITKEIIALDLRRDNAITGFNFLVRAYRYSPDPAKKAAAHRIEHALSPYGTIGDMALTEETTAIANALNDLRAPALLPDVTLLHGAEWVTEIEHANTEFNSRYLARSAEHPNSGDAPNISEMRPAAVVAWNGLAQRVAGLYIANRGAQPWAGAVGVVINVVDQYNDLIARRTGGEEEEG